MKGFETPPQVSSVYDKLPNFLKKINDSTTKSPEEFFSASFSSNLNIYPELVKYLDENGKIMPKDGALPSFMDYVGDGFYTSDKEDPEIHIDPKGRDIRVEWEEWLAKCPNKTDAAKE